MNPTELESADAGDEPEFDPNRSELLTTSYEIAGLQADYDRIRRSLYVTEHREFFLVQNFVYAHGRRGPSATRRLLPNQARAWCLANGLDARIVDRYFVEQPQTGATAEFVAMLTQRWGSASTSTD